MFKHGKSKFMLVKGQSLKSKYFKNCSKCKLWIFLKKHMENKTASLALHTFTLENI